MKRNNYSPFFTALLLLAAFWPFVSLGQEVLPQPWTTSTNEIVFGQSGSFSGSLGLYGTIIKNAIQLCFDAANEQGGVNAISCA